MYDGDIRASLRAQIEATHGDDPSTVVVDELGLCQGNVRVDLAVVNGLIKGYEIKSAADTLRRLPGQAAVYNQVMDEMSIVLTECHRKDAVEAIPEWWEVLVATRMDATHVEIHCVRPGSANPSINARALAELLWQADALALLRERGAHRGLARASRDQAWDRIAQVCSVDEVRNAVRARIKERAARKLGQ